MKFTREGTITAVVPQHEEIAVGTLRSILRQAMLSPQEFEELQVQTDRMATYTRLYSDEAGESHFADVEIDLTLTEYAPPAPPLELSSTTSTRHFGFMNAPAGWSSDWHPTSARNIFCVLSGDWEVTASDGETRRFSTGSVLLVDDTTGKGHASRVISQTDSLALMVQLDD